MHYNKGPVTDKNYFTVSARYPKYICMCLFITISMFNDHIYYNSVIYQGGPEPAIT